MFKMVRPDHTMRMVLVSLLLVGCAKAISPETTPIETHHSTTARSQELIELRKSIRAAELLIDVLHICEQASLSAETAVEHQTIVDICEAERARRR